MMEYEVLEITLSANEKIKFSDGRRVVAVLHAVESRSTPGMWYVTVMTELEIGHD